MSRPNAANASAGASAASLAFSSSLWSANVAVVATVFSFWMGDYRKAPYVPEAASGMTDRRASLSHRLNTDLSCPDQYHHTDGSTLLGARPEPCTRGVAGERPRVCVMGPRPSRAPRRSVS